MIGFLYQMIGLLALRVWATDSDAVNNTELETLLALIRDGELYHEKKDIDGLGRRIGLDHPDALVLLQFKFSHHPERYPVTPDVLANICQGFLREVQHWSPKQRNITSYRVITNRPVSETLRPVMERPSGEREHEKFTTPELRRMLQDIEILEDLDFSQWTEALKHFTDEYGVEEEEFEAGVSRLIGDLAKHASVSEAPPIREEDLIKIFRGYDRPRKLTVSAIRSLTADEWDWIKDQLGLQGKPVRRQLLAKAIEMLARPTNCATRLWKSSSLIWWAKTARNWTPTPERRQKQRDERRKEQKMREIKEQPGKEAMRLHSEKQACPRRGNLKATDRRVKPWPVPARWQSLLRCRTV